MSVIIVGGGCSGVLVACNLLRLSTNKIDLTIIEPQAELGHGLAYSTQCSAHLLNVISQNMSAYPDDKDHLLRWLDNNQFDANPHGFIPRATYAQYLQSCLIEAKEHAANKNSTLTVIQDTVIDLEQQELEWRVTTKHGQKIIADSVVLALGVFLKTNQTNFISNPWRYDLQSIPATAKIALIGSGLSMADMLLQLKQQNHLGSITVFARNGAIPLAHDLNSFTHKLQIDWPIDSSLSELYKLFKRNLKTILHSGYTWHNLIDSLRPYTQKIWQNWDDVSRQRFIRLLRSKWDTHRHRVAPQIAQQLVDLQQQGFYSLLQASVCKVEPGSDVQVHFNQDGKLKRDNYDLVIDCAGLLTDYAKADSPVLQNLFRRKTILAGPLSKGLQASPDLELQSKLYTLGFALHGMLWESIAVPELRVQAQQVSQHILSTN